MKTKAKTSSVKPILIRNGSNLNIPTDGNKKLEKILKRINSDLELQTLWRMQNVTAINRLGMSDHGPVHMQVTANGALKILRLLKEGGIKPNLEKDFDGFSGEDSEVVVALGAIMHDIGMSIHRKDHEKNFYTAQPIIDRLLDGIYDTVSKTIIRSEILHCIFCHRSDGKPLTVEAGAVRVGDALDMTEGRSCVSMGSGKLDIHLISAAAIKKVRIHHGEKSPIKVNIEMQNSAGIFQLDDLLKEKIKGSGLEKFMEIEVDITGGEKRLIEAESLKAL